MIWTVLLASLARAEDRRPIDLSLATGVVLGTVSELQEDGRTREFKVGGAPLAASFNRDLAEKWTTTIQAQILLDVINKQLLRQGVSASLAYHLFGGARLIDNSWESLQVVSTSDYNFSLVGRCGIFNFAATDIKNPKQNLSGGVWELAAGIDYRKSLSSSHAVGFNILHSLMTLPASVTRLDTEMNELLLYWRTNF